MKRRHIVIAVLVLLLAGIGFLVYKTLASLDQIIEAGIEKYGPEIAGADVRLDGVKVNLAAGEAELNGLFIGNPDGFQTEYALKLHQVKVGLDLESVATSPIVIREIVIQAPDVIYEMAKGGSNIDRLSGNIDAYTGGEKQQQEESDGPKLIIDDLYIRDGKVSVSHSAFKGKTITSPLPDIHLEDIGRKEGGASPGEVAKAVMDKIKSGAGSVAGKATEAFQSGASTVMEKGKEAGAAIKEGVSGAGEKIKGWFDKD